MPYSGTAVIREIEPLGGVVDRNDPQAAQVVSASVALRFGAREIAFDGLMSVSHDTSLNVTSYPTEAGADLFDHTYENPIGLRMVGGVSLLSDTSPLNAWARIQQLRLSRRLVVITTDIGQYSNMILIRAATVEDAETQGAIIVDLEFQEVLVPARPESSVDGAVGSGPAQYRLTQNVNRGYIAPIDSQDPNLERTASRLPIFSR